MNLLLSNDDGVHAPGLATLIEHCKNAGFNVTVVAPDRDRSGASNSLTLDRPLHPIHLSDGAISINGTPTDCVHLAINSLCKTQPDRVISGINSGANLGDDVLYSGTVAAAMEGRFLDNTPMAISLVGKTHFATAARVTLELLSQLDKLKFPGNTLININVPDVPYEQLTGIEVTRLGHRQRSDNPVKSINPRGKECYWISGVGAPQDAGPGTDFYAVTQNKVSITPIKVDMTSYDVQASLKELTL